MKDQLEMKDEELDITGDTDTRVEELLRGRITSLENERAQVIMENDVLRIKLNKKEKLLQAAKKSRRRSRSLPGRDYGD